ncbi:long-chain fatty acid--CoA ligase [Streptomyces sp. NPDC001315]|uniref:long-chain-fatty-acid--CoA ligase n=1 Tax=Streptomyces sp. NPDC001315 TaxID=3364562 RepID=UPI00368DD4CE
MLNLASMLEYTARHHPDREAVTQGPLRLTYAELDAAANRVANLLADRGIGRGDRVALSCPNRVEFPTLYYGILKAGAAVVPLNVMLQPREIAYHLTDSQVKAFFCHAGPTAAVPASAVAEAVAQAPSCEHLILITDDPADDSPLADVPTLSTVLASRSDVHESVCTLESDTAVILYTSGTTGSPKGAELTHANMTLNALTCHRTIEARQDDVHLIVLPLFHSFGQTVQMNAIFGIGARMVLMPRFEAAKVMRTLAREKVTVFAGVPTMYWKLLEEPVDDDTRKAVTTRLRMAISGGAALAVEIAERFRKAFGISIHEGYGLSETSPMVTFQHPGRPPKPGSVGGPVWGVEMRLVDPSGTEVTDGEPGEVAIRGHNVMKGYFGRPDATAEVLRDGWFFTGDIARRDADGDYVLVDRAKDLIIRGGYNVYPRELEEALLTHPDVSLAAVVGVPHPVHGEEVKAYVVRRQGSHLSQDALRTWCKSAMAAYKYPRLFEFCDELPMTASGKILKRQLK